MVVSAKAEIERIKKKSEKYSGKDFSFWCIESDTNKVHVLIPKKVIKIAVSRNKVRRAYVSVLSKFAKEKGVTALVLVRRYNDESAKEIEKDILDLLNKVV